MVVRLTAGVGCVHGRAGPDAEGNGAATTGRAAGWPKAWKNRLNGSVRKVATFHFRPIFLLAAGMGLMLLGACGEPPQGVLTTRAVGSAPAVVEVSGRMFARRYNAATDRECGHHAVVWREGRAAHKALIEVDTPDLEVQSALERLGWVPGDNLKPEAWEDRFNASNPEPDRRVEGAAVSITVEWTGLKEPIELAGLLRDLQPADVRIRFGGHRAYVNRWRSGCVVCLFSCPGGRMSNAAHTIREQAAGRPVFLADADRLPADGTVVRVRFAAGSEGPDSRPAAEAGR